MSISEQNPLGYFSEADLKYPDNLHKLHNDYPLAPKKLAVSIDMLSKYYRKIADKYQINVGDVKILIPNICNKKKLCNLLQKSSAVFVFRNETDSYEGFK